MVGEQVMDEENDIEKLLNQVRSVRKAQPRGYKQRTLKLEVHRHRIMLLKRSGASLQEIKNILQYYSNPSVTVSRTTIKSFIDKTVKQQAIESADLF